MPDPGLLTVFFLSSIVLALSPGPDNLFVMTQSAQHGRVAGLLVTLGLCTGLIGHTAAVTLGLAAVLQASAGAFMVLKALGAAYLLFLAWQAFRSGGSRGGSVNAPAMTPGRLYVRGIIMNLSNPKVSIFFLAFLPQFVIPGGVPFAIQICLLGALFMLAAFLVFSGLSVLAGGIGRWLRNSPGAQRTINILSGLIFTGLATRLIMSER